MAEISKMLPGYNCGECGHRQCKDYAEEISIKGDISKCLYLELERFIDTKAEIQQFLSNHIVVEDKVEDLPPVPPLVKYISDGSALIRPAILRRASSIASFASLPKLCRLDAFP